MNKTTIKTLLISGGLILSQTAMADGWSIGVMAGQANDSRLGDACNEAITDDSSSVAFTCDNDESDTAAGVNIAFGLTDNFGLEAGYVDLGETTSTLTGTSRVTGRSLSGDITAAQTATYLAGTASFNIGEQWSLTGRLGYYDISADIESTVSTTSIDTEADVYFGTSVDYHFNDHLTAQLRYDNFDADVVSLGLQYNF